MKHNRKKMEEHLSLTAHQLVNTQHNLASNQLEAIQSREKLTAKITQTGKDLASTKQQLTCTQINTVKTIDRLVADRKIKKNYSFITAKVKQVKKKSKEQLALTKGDLSLRLQQTEDDIKTKD